MFNAIGECPDEVIEVSSESPFEGSGIIRADQIRSECVDWLWEPYLARGKITLLDGLPGVGKSFLAAKLAASVTSGNWMHGEAISDERGTVLMISPEDGLSDTMKPRLIAVGADLTKVVLANQPVVLNETGFEDLNRWIESFAPTLVIIDPLQNVVESAAQMFGLAESAQLFGRLKKIAEMTKTAFLVVRHFRKGSGDAIDAEKGIGSQGLMAAARLAMTVTKDEIAGAIVVKQVKNNLAALGPAFRFSIEDGAVRWGGFLSSGDLPVASETARAARWIAAELKSKGKILSVSVENSGFSKSTIERAKKVVGVRSKRIGNAWYFVADTEQALVQECQGPQDPGGVALTELGQ